MTSPNVTRRLPRRKASTSKVLLGDPSPGRDTAEDMGGQLAGLIAIMHLARPSLGTLSGASTSPFSPSSSDELHLAFRNVVDLDPGEGNDERLPDPLSAPSIGELLLEVLGGRMPPSCASGALCSVLVRLIAVLPSSNVRCSDRPFVGKAGGEPEWLRLLPRLAPRAVASNRACSLRTALTQPPMVRFGGERADLRVFHCKDAAPWDPKGLMKLGVSGEKRVSSGPRAPRVWRGWEGPRATCRRSWPQQEPLSSSPQKPKPALGPAKS